jgi:hypothetical protein
LQILLIAGLVIVCRNTSGVVKNIAAFGLAAVVASVVGYARVIILPELMLELLLYTSVVYISIENLYVESGDDRWIIAFAFGLLHGFVNAAILAEMGLPNDNRVMAIALYGLVGICCYLVLALGCFIIFRSLARRIPQRGLVYSLSIISIVIVVLICFTAYLI